MCASVSWTCDHFLNTFCHHLLANATTDMTDIRQHHFKAAFIFLTIHIQDGHSFAGTDIKILLKQTTLTATSKTQGATSKKETHFSMYCTMITPGQTQPGPLPWQHLTLSIAGTNVLAFPTGNSFLCHWMCGFGSGASGGTTLCIANRFGKWIWIKRGLAWNGVKYFGRGQRAKQHPIINSN